MTFCISIPQPFNFENTLKTHGWFQLPPFYWDEATHSLKWAIRLNGEPVLINLKTENDTKTEHVVRIDGDVDATFHPDIEKKFRHILNLDLDLSGYYKTCTADPVLKKVPQRGIGRLMRAESLWEDLFKSICGTNVQWKQAVKMVHNIAVLGDKVPGTDYRLFPTPQQIRQAGEAFLKETGRVGYRSAYLIHAAERFDHGEPDAMRVEKNAMPADEKKKYFLGFQGIGPTTARYLMALYGHFDEMAVDSLVVKYMTEHHFNGVKPTNRQIEAFYDRFGPWRYLAYWMEFIVNEGWSPDA